MNQPQRNNGAETHPLFPSGDWEGFYTYATGPAADKHAMAFILNFKNQVITGSGSDDVSNFAWKGTYNISQMNCALTKYYRTHTVYYQGQVDENGIWGMWRIEGLSGGFHIWPKASASHEAAVAVAVEAVVLIEPVPVIVPERPTI